jgi:hypothetical protein
VYCQLAVISFGHGCPLLTAPPTAGAFPILDQKQVRKENDSVLIVSLRAHALGISMVTTGQSDSEQPTHRMITTNISPLNHSGQTHMGELLRGVRVTLADSKGGRPPRPDYNVYIEFAGVRGWVPDHTLRKPSPDG